MKKIAWATDIHVDRLIERDYLEYKDYLRELEPDCLIVSGDIAEGERVCECLRDFDESFDFPIFFVLGNHDFYFKSFAEVEKNVRETVENAENLRWLSETGIVELDAETALIGIEGWGDGRCGTLNLSEGRTRDIFTIEDYKNLDAAGIGRLLAERGALYAERLEPVLQKAVEKYRKILFVTHVPPFAEVCFDRSLRIIPEFKQPFYICGAIGDMLLETLNAHPACRMTVLCGHTHEKADRQILENLRVRVKESGYGAWWDATIINTEKL